MSDFELFNKVLKEYNKKQPLENVRPIKEDDSTGCVHKNIVTEKGISVCKDCGLEIDVEIVHNKEWRYYGPSDSKHSSDPNRVQVRKSDDRTIYRDVENMNFSDNVVSMANKIYTDVTNGQIKRGNSRKAIVFACIFHAYKLIGKPQSHEKLIRIFSLSKKTGLKGLKQVALKAPKFSKVRTTYIRPVNLIDETMDKFFASDKQKKEVIELYDDIKNKSSRLNRSRPQSVACSIIYYWICLKKKDISLENFAKKSSLSKLTISKLAKEIERVLGAENVVILK